MIRPTLHVRLLLALVLLVLLSVTSYAQMPNGVGIFLDAAGTQTTGLAFPFEPVELYVVAFDVPEVGAVEMRIDPPSELTVTQLTLHGTPPICIVCPVLPDLSYVVDCMAGGPTLRLITVTGMMLGGVTDDVVLCLEPTTISSFDPPTPGYALCDRSTLVPFTLVVDGGDDYPDGCAVLNPTGESPVGADAVSWGSVKATF